MKCLVTGAAGNLGREVVARLAGAYDVIGLGHQQGGLELLRADLRDPVALRGVLASVGPDVVVHCAAYRDPDFCEEQPEETRRLNVAPVRVMAEALPPAARLVFISSDYVFDGEHPPYREESPRGPLNVYGQSKAEAEDAALARPHSLVLRIPLLVGAGPDLDSSGFIAHLLQPLASRTRQELDDVLVRVPTWTRDVAEAIAFLLERGAEGVFHVSAPRGQTRYAWTVELARMLGEPWNHLVPSKAVVVRKAARPRDATLATSKIRSLGYDRLTDFRDVAKAVLSSFGRWR